MHQGATTMYYHSCQVEVGEEVYPSRPLLGTETSIVCTPLPTRVQHPAMTSRLTLVVAFSRWILPEGSLAKNLFCLGEQQRQMPL
jgi:hypothetical protein